MYNGSDFTSFVFQEVEQGRRSIETGHSIRGNDYGLENIARKGSELSLIHI